jgi:hypothetical protein
MNRSVRPAAAAVALLGLFFAHTACERRDGAGAGSGNELSVYAFDTTAGSLAPDAWPDRPAAVRPVPEMKIIDFDAAGSITFAHFPISGWYRKPLLLKKGDIEILFCFDSPFFSSIDTRQPQLDAVIWYPLIESQFGLPPARDAPLTCRIDFVKKEAGERLRRMFKN